jgi:hypothetical protein
VEKEYEKVDKLLDIRDNAKSRLKATERQIETEKQVTYPGRGLCVVNIVEIPHRN